MPVDRKFFHDAVNLVSIARGMSAIAKTLLDSGEASGVAKANEKLAKCTSALERLEKLILEAKTEFKASENSGDKNAA